MTNRILWLTLAVVIGLLFLQNVIAEAGTYNLQYPAGYGCNCAPNVLNYGVFKTQWRTWPGEQRLDLDHPKIIGAEKLKPVPGYEQLPLPRQKLQDIAPGGTITPDNPNSALPKDQFPANPAPGGATPGGGAAPGGGGGLPNMQPGPGGFTPQPGLPQDFGMPGLEDNFKKPAELPKDTPAPLEKKDNTSGNSTKNSKSATGKDVGAVKYNSESPKKGTSNQLNMNRNSENGEMKSYVPTRLPDTGPAKSNANNTDSLSQYRPQADWDSALQVGNRADSFRSGTIYPSTNYAKQANYQPAAETSGVKQTPVEVVQQSFQQNQPSPEKTASAMPADLRQLAAPPIALQGFCPVALSHEGRWVQGDPRWTVIHQGFTYRLSGNEQRTQFLANPERFVPVNGGNDPVIAAKERRNAPGEVSYCAEFKGRIYMFTSAATQAEFQKNPERFVDVK